ncbi:hypothetical protein Q9966_001345 [Columba livia]|nr:hypothetical protein Q9966_001345 [Columba livia]
MEQKLSCRYKAGGRAVAVMKQGEAQELKSCVPSEETFLASALPLLPTQKPQLALERTGDGNADAERKCRQLWLRDSAAKRWSMKTAQESLLQEHPGLTLGPLIVLMAVLNFPDDYPG